MVDQEAHGGAGIAAARLSGALNQAGHEVHCLTARPSGQRHPWKSWHLRLRSREEAFWLMVSRAPGASAAAKRLRHGRLNRVLHTLLQTIKPDVVNLHNLHWADWPVSFLNTSSEIAPTVWTLHDMWSFTGGCTFSLGETAFRSGCDQTCECWVLYGGNGRKEAAGEWRARARAFSGATLPVAVCPSGWLAGQASRSLWKEHRIETIPNGLCLKTYEPMPRDFARRALGVSVEGLAVLGCGVSLDDPRKGSQAFMVALHSIRHRPLTLITLGSEPPMDLPPHVRVHHLGSHTSERMQALVYNAADLLLFPTLADNLPNVLVEALACGTPAVSTSVGGVPEIIEDGVCGWLSASTTGQDVAACLERALSDLAGGVDMRQPCRARAIEKFDLFLQAQHYSELFDSCLKRVSPRSAP